MRAERRTEHIGSAADFTLPTELRRLRIRRIFVYFFLLSSLALLLLLNLNLGSVKVSAGDVVDAILCRGNGNMASRIIWMIRLPRLLAALWMGAALAISGYLLQAFFNNPIAGPYTLGISSGAKLAVVAYMLVALKMHGSTSSLGMVGAAFGGAMLACLFVLLMARRVERSATLILAGVMLGYISSAVTDFMITFADESHIISMHEWAGGSFSGISWSQLNVAVGVLIPLFIAVLLLSKSLGIYRFGAANAHNLGLHLGRFRLYLILLSSLAAAVVAAFAGPISFVGIAVPHVIKRLLKSSSPLLVIPACLLGGSIFCLLCDLVARTAFAPTELKINTVTALFGAPIVIAIMLKRRRD